MVNRKPIEQRFNQNAEEFDNLMVEMLGENKDLKGLLYVAKCPACNGDGAMYDFHGDIEQCQWCYEKNTLLKDIGEENGDKEETNHW